MFSGRYTYTKTSLSVKRSLDGIAGKCPTIGLQNELSDNKIDERNDGQKGEQWH